jgi:Protein of unknown function (DUF1524)
MRSDVWKALLGVEHIAPQFPQRNDPSYDPEIFTKGMVDRIGNLTILPETLNSFIGNRPWVFKKSVFRAISIDNSGERRSELLRLLPGASAPQIDKIVSRPFLPIVKSLGESEGDVLAEIYVEKRGRQVGFLAYKMLSGWLGYPIS